VRPTSESYGLAAESDFHALALVAAADHRVRPWIGHSRQELVVLTELEILDDGAVREWDALELDHASNTRAGGDVAGVDGDAVGDVEQSVRMGSEPLALTEP
jgi:hypothetical protein